MAVLCLLKEHPEGLTVSESSKLLKEEYHPIQIQIYRNLEYGNLRKEGLKYFLTSRGLLTIEGVTVKNLAEGVTVGKIDNRGKHKHAIYGFSLTLYEYIQRHEGLSTASMSSYFLKNKDYVKQYLYRLKDYGLIINDRGNWYSTSKKPITEAHFIKVNSTDQAAAVLMEG